ncbi:hypothetical protein ABZY31_14945 [Streptomyces sp. NPDC006529]|uniref:hypothetical protein n=1 Tax=Streptomyces sp. NPDC006529 TaxID=3157177 RepID=UPI0033AB9E16
MALIRWNGIHEAIEEHVRGSAFFGRTEFLVPMGTRTIPVAASEGRDVVYGPQCDVALRAALWQLVVRNARDECSEEEDWRMYAVWLASPGLRRTSYRAASRMGAERKDVEAELLLALIEEIRSCDPDAPDVGTRVLRAVHGRAWTYARTGRQEVAVAEVTEQHASWDPLREGNSADSDPSWALEVSSEPTTAGLSATVRFTGSAARLEGERLGVLAERLGLEDVVFRARRSRRGRRVGSLALCDGRDGR